MLYLIEQCLNGLQLGVMLFLLVHLVLVFGIMDLVDLAHGSLYMIGAYLCAATFAAVTNTSSPVRSWGVLGGAVLAGSHGGDRDFPLHLRRRAPRPCARDIRLR